MVRVQEVERADPPHHWAPAAVQTQDLGPPLPSMPTGRPPTLPTTPNDLPTAPQTVGDGTGEARELSAVELSVLRAKMRTRLESLRLKRLPRSVRERTAAAAALSGRGREGRRARKRDAVQRFPLRAVAPAAPTEAVREAIELFEHQRPSSVSALLDAVLGLGTDEDKIARVPEAPGPDDKSVAPLPQTQVKLRDLEIPTTTPLDPVGDEITLDFQTPIDWMGARQWGRALNPTSLPAEDRRELRQLLYKELRIGALRPRPSPDGLLLITPVSVVRSGSGGKLRLVHDLRPLNCRLSPSTVRYASVRDAVDLGGRYCTKLDLAAAFKHIPVSAQAEACMAFQLGGMYFSWKRLPFGLAHSPALFQSALAPALSEAAAAGVRLTSYVDDLYVVADSIEDLDAAVVRLLDVLSARGWRIAADKAFPFAHERLTFLGLSVAPASGEVAVPPAKAAKLKNLCTEALSGQRVTMTSLQRVTGLLAFFLVAVPTVGLFWRALHGACHEAELAPGRHVWVRGGLKQELEFWRDHADELPAWPAMPPASEQTELEFGIASDASDTGAGAIYWDYKRDPTPDLAAWSRGTPISGFCARIWGFSEAEGSESSAVRELLALRLALLDLVSRVSAPPLPSGSGSGGAEPVATSAGDESRRQRRASIRVRWYSDSQAAVCALRKWRSSSLPVSSVLTDILSIIGRHGIVLVPSWVSRELDWLPAADYLSRVVGQRLQAEWSVPVREFRRACGLVDFKPVCDLFATRRNARCPAFRSKFPETGGRVDALGSPWPRRSYAFPPFSLCDAALRHWRRTGRRGDRLLLLGPGDLALPTGVQLLRRFGMAPDARLMDVHGKEVPRAPPRSLTWRLLELR